MTVRTNTPSITLGLRENLGQFSLLVLVNAFVGAMVGMERSILPALADTWSTTVIMKIDLAGPKSRGLAMVLNEFAGYFADALETVRLSVGVTTTIEEVESAASARVRAWSSLASAGGTP